MNSPSIDARATVLALAAALIALVPALASAASLSKSSAKTEPKKVVLSFSFSEGVDYEPVFHYKDNYVALKVKDLKFSSKQLRAGLAPSGSEQKACFRRVGYSQLKGEGEIRIALSKQRSPGDVQVTPEDSVIRVEIFLPSALVKAGKAGDAGEGFIPRGSNSGNGGNDAGEEEESSGPGPSTWPPQDNGAEAEAEENGAEESGAEESAAEESGVEESAAEEPGGFRGGAEAAIDEGEAAALEALAELEEATSEPAGMEESEAGMEEEAEESAGAAAEPIDSGPSYKQFDLSTVPVVQQQFTSVPLNEAVQRLIGDSGFNVVVGEGVNDTLVTLNFNQNQMSLKRALNALCMAYDLEYSVEDDVIIVRGK